VTGIDLKVTSFDQKSPGSGCRSPKARVSCTFHFLQGYLAGDGSHVTGNDVTWPQVTGSYPEVTSFDRKSPGSGCRRPKTPVYSTFDFLQRCSSRQEAITWQKMTSCDLRWLEVTQNWCNLIGNLLEVAVEGQKLPYNVHFTSHKAVSRIRRQSRDRKYRHVTSLDRKWPVSDVIWPEVTWKWL